MRSSRPNGFCPQTGTTVNSVMARTRSTILPRGAMRAVKVWRRAYG
jgi:hypothetical protein